MKSKHTWVRRSQRVIRMVSELHRMGYQRLRIMPYVHPLAYRILVGPKSAFSVHNGAYSPGENEWATYSAASENHYFNWRDAEKNDARALAEKFVVRFHEVAELGRGRDWEYAGWLSELIGKLEARSWLPFVSAEQLKTKPYSLTALPFWEADVPSDTPGWPDQQFPLPPPGELNDDPAEFTGKWGPSGMKAALELASQPNYLGSPDVVNALTGELLTAAVDQQIDSAKKSEFTTARKKIARAVSGEDTSYTTMPAWHCKEALGRHLVECFGFDTNFCAGESLAVTTFVCLGAVGSKVGELLDSYEKDSAATWEADALPQLQRLQQFVTAVLMGTESVMFRDTMLPSFSWKPAEET